MLSIDAHLTILKTQIYNIHHPVQKDEMKDFAHNLKLCAYTIVINLLHTQSHMLENKLPPVNMPPL